MDIFTLNAAKAYAEQLALGGAGLQETVETKVNEYLAKEGISDLSSAYNLFLDGTPYENEKNNMRCIFDGNTLTVDTSNATTSGGIDSKEIPFKAGKYVVVIDIHGDNNYNHGMELYDNSKKMIFKLATSLYDFALSNSLYCVVYENSNDFALYFHAYVTITNDYSNFANTLYVIPYDLFETFGFSDNLTKTISDKVGLSTHQIVYNGNIDTYYIANDGSDDNDGRTTSTPLKTVDKLTGKKNINIYFKSGDTFQLIDFKPLDNTTIGTYGGVVKARIDGFIKNSTRFSKVTDSENLYEVTMDSDKFGIIKYNNNLDWKWVQDTSKDLVSDGEYHLDGTTLTIYSDTDLTNVDVYYAHKGYGIYTKSSNVNISNLEIYGYSNGGIAIWEGASNCKIEKNYVHHVGGLGFSNQNVRQGNGIGVWTTNVHDILIRNNIVSDCFDAGISPQINSSGTAESYNIYVENNIIKRCYYALEYFNSTNYTMKNIIFRNNFLFDAKDITDGYRNESNTSSLSLICVWKSMGEADTVVFENNIGLLSGKYAIFLSEPDNCKKVLFNGNVWGLESDTPIKGIDSYPIEDTVYQLDRSNETDYMTKYNYLYSRGNQIISDFLVTY